MKTGLLLTTALLLHAAVAAANPPRITFMRTVAPAYDLGPAERLAVIYAIGDNAKIDTFLEHFVDVVTRAGRAGIENAVESNHHIVLDDHTLHVIRRRHPADKYLGVKRFTCTGEEKQAEGSERDESGERIRRMHHWIDAQCSARIDVIDPDGKKLFSYTARGEGTSPRSAALSEDEKDVAYEQASRFAAVSAAGAITPRIVRESIDLDENAPAFDEGFSMVRSERLDDARAIWQAAAIRHRDSAPLYFDLGAVCEAMGELRAAGDYYEKAAKLSPKVRRYVTELHLFRRRAVATRK
jgi:hypothetical protein